MDPALNNSPRNEANFVPRHQGEMYTKTLARLHKVLQPKTYFEIGTLHGSTLQLASCKCIAVDPNFRIDKNVFGSKEELHIYQLPSDDFFARHDPAEILKQKIDFAFLDGMHLFEFLLRDFINTEKSCKTNSVIAMHDCIPIDVYMDRRENVAPEIQKLSQEPGWWCGDVWKVVSILKKYRPNLKIVALDAAPTGLILVTNLDPASALLSDSYFQVVEEFSNKTLFDGKLASYYEEINLRSTKDFESIENITKEMWP